MHLLWLTVVWIGLACPATIRLRAEEPDLTDAVAVDASHGPCQQLTADGVLKSDPTFLANGRDLVFTLQESAVQTSLMKLDLENGLTTRLYPKATTTEFEPAFSPDGRYCAFVQNKGNLSLRLVIRDQENSLDAEFDPGGGFAGMRHPTIAPDASCLVISVPATGGEHLVKVGMDGKRLQDLTQGESLNCWPTFSPDGQQIAFGSSRDGDFEIYLMNHDGGDLRRLTSSPGRDMRPAWSPDGQRIAFVSSRDGNSEIYVMRCDGSELYRATNHPERDDYPAWHPEGRLAFVGERHGRFDLYLLDLDSR